jgi:hypothetical protein
MAAVHLGDAEEGRQNLQRVLADARDLGQTEGVAIALIALAALAAAGDASERAARLAAASERLAEEAGFQVAGFERETRERTAASAREALGDHEFGRAWGEGRALTLEQAVEYALETA